MLLTADIVAVSFTVPLELCQFVKSKKSTIRHEQLSHIERPFASPEDHYSACENSCIMSSAALEELSKA